MPTVFELTVSASLIFSGTVVERGTSTVPTVPPSQNLVVVRVDRPLRVDPVLGDLRGKLVTVVATAPENLSSGQRAVFFTNSWIHGRGIAVREVQHIDVHEEDEVASAVAQLPQVHLTGRLRNAELVVDAKVVRIDPVERKSFERNVAHWVAAPLEINRVLRGQSREPAIVYFPTSDHPLWARAPRFSEGQRGIFILHAPDRNRSPSEASLDAGSLVALDPADFQPQSELDKVQQLLAAIAAEGGHR
jgi:hypothetical protein